MTKRALQEIFRVFAPGGVVNIATSNSFGRPHLSGAKDSSHLPFGLLVPRFLTSGVIRFLLKVRYGIVADSMGGYRKLSVGSGLEKVSFYWPIDDHQRSGEWVNLSRANDIRRAFASRIQSGARQGFLAARAQLGILKYFSPHIGVFAIKPD